MLLPDDKGGWGSALIDAAKNLPHGVETTLRQAGRQIAVHSDDIPDIESISDLEDIRQNPEEYAERFNRERTKGTISADPNDSTNKAVREKQMRDEVYRAKYGHLENPVGSIRGSGFRTLLGYGCARRRPLFNGVSRSNAGCGHR